jgi:hypothetical protein
VSDQTDQPFSPTIERPEFNVTIPEFLREKLTLQEQALLLSFSKIEQQGNWSVDNLIRLSQALNVLAALHQKLRLDVKQHSESWTLFQGKTAALRTIGLLLAGATVPKLWDIIIYLINHK